MITEELLGFIRGQYEAGMSVDEMKDLLIAEGGWNTADIDEAFQSIGVVPTEVTSPSLPELTPKTESEILEPSPLNALTSVDYAPSLSTIASSGEGDDSALTSDTNDFLGIFSPHQPTEEVFSPPPLMTKPLEVASLPVAESVPPPQSIASALSVPEIPATFATEVPAQKESKIIIEMTPQESLEVTSAPEAQKEQAPQMAISSSSSDIIPPPPPSLSTLIPPPSPVNTEEAKVNTPPAPPPVTFDLSMLRKSIANDSAASVVNTKNENAGKTVETKSVAELWLQGARKEANNPPNVTPNTAASERATRPKILSRRTMSSDILLRGGSGSIPGMPALFVPEEEKQSPQNIETSSGFKNKEEASLSAAASAPSGASVSSGQQTPLRTRVFPEKFAVKRLVLVVVGVVVLAAIAVGGWYMSKKLRGPDFSVISASAFQQFFGVTSFGYHGSASTSLILSTMSDGVDRNGRVEFAFDYGGLLANGANGYGDGLHHIAFKGGLHSGNFHWVTDLEADVRLIGSAMYFHVLSFPNTSNADPDLFGTYWIKFDVGDIAKELSLGGAVGTGEGYRGFGGDGKDTSFNTLIQHNLPFSVGARLPDVILPSGPAYHVELKSNPDQMIMIARILYNKYMNKDLVLDANQKLRLTDALAKIRFDILIDQKTNTLMQVSIHGDLDDDMVNVHVKGPLAFTFDLSDLNKQVSVPVPTPMLTLEELRVRMDDYKKVKEKRVRDAVKQNGLNEIQSALESYRTQKGRYPTFLIDLVALGKNSTSTISTINELMLKSYYYAAYVKPGVITKSGLCSVGGKVCTQYHLGVNFEDVTNPLLGNDLDQNTELRGGDGSGCGGEPDVACYDMGPVSDDSSIVPVLLPPVSTTTKLVN